MYKLRLLPALGMSTLLAVLALSVATASTNAFTPPALSVCKKVPAGEKGLWNSSNCEGTNVTSGEYAWSVADGKGKATIYCVLGGSTFTEALCETTGASGPFKEKLASEAFPKLLGAGGLGILNAKISGASLETDCKKNTFSGQPATATTLTSGTITFLECTPTKPANCEIHSIGEPTGTITTNSLAGEPASSRVAVTFRPETGSTFTEIEYLGSSCSLKGTKAAITGSQTCEYELSVTESAEEHMLTCKASGSKLELGGNAATLEGSAATMVEGAAHWRISPPLPALRVCKKVPAGEKGLWNSSNCEGTNVTSGEYAWSVADGKGKAIIYCVLGGTTFTEALCETTGASGPFKEKLASEAFPKLLGAGGLGTFKSKLAGVSLETDCKKNTFSGQPATATTIISGKITFLECTSTKPANCEIHSVGEPTGTITTSLLAGEPTSSRAAVNFRPETGTTFTEIEYLGSSCSLKGTNAALTGSQNCEFEVAATESAEEHTLSCKATGSKLELGSNKATAEGAANIMVEGGLFWLVR